MGKKVKFLDIYKQDKKIHYYFIKLLKKHFKSSDIILGKSVEIFGKNTKRKDKNLFRSS